jgi:hypothetical protein
VTRDQTESPSRHSLDTEPTDDYEGRLSQLRWGREDRQATVFFSDGGNVVFTGADADRVVNALEDFAHYPR